MKNLAKDVANAIDKHIEDTQEDGRRGHLGASVVGKKCDREVWYNWRWDEIPKHNAQLLRLFNRGHLEEIRFEPWLNSISDGFYPVDPDTGKQWRISDLKGYFGGSADGIIRNPCGYKGDFLTEFKTHNDKSFIQLALNGMRSHKPEHYLQMQIYMKYYPNLKGGIYFAINKNNDHMYVEYVERDSEIAEQQLERIKSILLSSGPPKRMEGAYESFYYCKYFCKKVDRCFNNKDPDKSCRSCRFVKLTDSGWKCGCTGRDDDPLSIEDQRMGCEFYERGF